MTPLAPAEFHFSDAERDAKYRRLEEDQEQKLALFRDAVDAARRAEKPPLPAPGTPAWFRIRDLVEKAILSRRPARDAIEALITFATRERLRLTGAEAEYAFDIRRVHEELLTATSDGLIDLLGPLVGIKFDGWPP
jgi:hypothetical protein